MGIFRKIFKSYSEKEVKRVMPIVDKINGLEEEISKLTDEELKNKTNELEIRVSQNNYDEKLAKRGIKITYFEITNFEEVDQKRQINNEEELKKLFLQLYKVSKNPEFIEAKNLTFSLNSKGEIITKKLEDVCSRCDRPIEKDDIYCKYCGARIEKKK